MDQSFSKFFEDLRNAKNQTQRIIMQSRFELANEILFKVQDNIRTTFGAGGTGAGVPRSPMTTASDGGTARGSGRGGGLFGSAMLAYEDKVLKVTVGGVGVPYAVAHEEGADIYPKNTKYLTIPVNPEARGKRAREMNLKVVHDPKWGLALRARDSKDVMFALRQHVRIPARPYFQPAVDEIANETKFRGIVQESTKGSLEVQVK